MGHLQTCSALGRVWRSGDEGISLIEVLVSVLLLTVAVLGLARLFAMAEGANLRSRTKTSASVLAAAKMEQLRSLTWAFDSAGQPTTDTQTDLSIDPPLGGGPGLSPSPPGSLEANMPPWVDYLDGRGQWVGHGGQPPEGTVYVRRWSVTPLPSDIGHTLVLQVVVCHLRDASSPQIAGSVPGSVRLIAAKTRKPG